MAKCSCGTTIPEGAGFCPECGKNAADSKGRVSSQGQSGVSTHTAAALTYFTFIPALVFLVLKPYNKNSFIRFHAWQSLCLTLGYAAVYFVVSFLLSLLGMTMSSRIYNLYIDFIDAAYFILSVVCMIQAHYGRRFKLPRIGDIAEKLAQIEI
jgi:uncharacterized membrane protein